MESNSWIIFYQLPYYGIFDYEKSIEFHSSFDEGENWKSTMVNCSQTNKKVYDMFIGKAG